MSDQDKHFTFLAGFRSWDEQELRRREVKTLFSALDAAEKLTEYERMPEDSSKSSKDGRDRKASRKKKWDRRKDVKNGKDREGYRGKSNRPLHCFICDGEHKAVDCPEKKLLDSIEQEGGKHAEGARMGSMKLLTAVQAKAQNVQIVLRPSKELLYVDIDIQGGRS